MNLMKKLKNWQLSLVSLVLLAPMAWGLPSDQQKLLHVSSQQLVINATQNTATYTGNVHAQQGTRQLWGDKTVIVRDTSGQLQSITTYGDPAKTQYLPKPGGTLAKGQAKTIHYIPGQNLVQYQHNAIIQQAGNIFKGEVIDYNTVTRIVTSPDTNQEQTIIILPPYDQEPNAKTHTTSSQSR